MIFVRTAKREMDRVVLRQRWKRRRRGVVVNLVEIRDSVECLRDRVFQIV